MNVNLTAEELEFQDQVRAFFAEKYPADIRDKHDRGIPLTREEGAWQTYGPSAVPYANWHVPEAMTAESMARVKEAFAQAARRAARLDRRELA